MISLLLTTFVRLFKAKFKGQTGIIIGICGEYVLFTQLMLPWARRKRCIRLVYLHRWCRIVDGLMWLLADLSGTPTPLPIFRQSQQRSLCICTVQLFRPKRLLLNLATHQQPTHNKNQIVDDELMLATAPNCPEYFCIAVMKFEESRWTYFVRMFPQDVWWWIADNITRQRRAGTHVCFDWFWPCFEYRTICEMNRWFAFKTCAHICNGWPLL